MIKYPHNINLIGDKKMGYFSTFSVSIDKPYEDNEELYDDIVENIQTESGYEFDYQGEDIYLYDSKWYDLETDMKTVSAEFPDVLITVYRVGEENGDLAYYYFKNGKMQHAPAKVAFDDYDESKLV